MVSTLREFPMFETIWPIPGMSLGNLTKEKSKEEAKLITFHIHYLLFFGRQISVEPLAGAKKSEGVTEEMMFKQLQLVVVLIPGDLERVSVGFTVDSGFDSPVSALSSYLRKGVIPMIFIFL